MQQAYKRAEERGAIYQIHSKPEKLTDEVLGLDFVLHVADALKDKPRAVLKREGGPIDAFESLDDDLTVDYEFSATHMLRLNKFNVVPYHSLVITRAPESQQSGLTLEDWESTLATMQAYPDGALAYFNSDAAAGASQPRKHLQVLPTQWGGFCTVPLPFQGAVEAAWEEAGRPHLQALALRRLPFQSFATMLPERAVAADCHEACSKLLAARPVSSRHASYNILATENLMMLVPRAREKCGPVSCNAVIFAGTLLVRSTAELDFVRSNGPLQILQEVTLPWDTQEQ